MADPTPIRETVPRISDAEIAAYLLHERESAFIVEPGEFLSDVLDEFVDKPPGPPTTPFPKWAGRMDFRPGELTVWAAYNSHRKSMLIGQLVLYWLATGRRCCIASMEMPPRRTLKRMAVQAARSKKPSTAYLVRWMNWVSLDLRLYDQQGTISPDRIVSLIRYYGGALKGEFIVIDSLMKCGIAEDDSPGLQRFMNELTSAARDTGCHVILVHHVRKAQDESKIPGKMDLKGTGNISDQADNVVIQWIDKKLADEQSKGIAPTDKPHGYLVVEKQRFGEWEGAIPLFFDEESLHHLDYDRDRPFNWEQIRTPTPRQSAPREPGQD
ncbi:MAG: AAA family ATPase [Rhodospirillales bacterium]|nr:AAA family ATPase [Rhodospirillales bacterium]